jgi:leucyl-tRNA synthetase
MVVAPEHPIIAKLVTKDTKKAVEEYCKNAIKKSEIERQENKEKTGVFTGSYAINPATGELMQIWVADYVLFGYGTGAIMAVPSGDERDFEFATKFKLPIIKVVERPEGMEDDSPCYVGEGTMVNSGPFTGRPSSEVREEINDWLEQQGYGKKKVTYKMRDWLISRQRYWGCPIPIAYDKNGNPHPIPEDQLPVIIPEVEDYRPDHTGRSALAKAKDWLKVTIDGEEMTRETDTLDGYACSSWYLWRYASPHDSKHAWDPDAINYWEPLDYYCGGDHAVAHLLYVRFWCKFFADEGYLPFREPIKRLLYNGYINAPDGKKMSKSKGNVIDPLDVINDGYGADTLRTYEMFIGPYDQDAAWDPRSVGGVYRFLNRSWSLVCDKSLKPSAKGDTTVVRHKTIKKVTEDIHRFSFNTAVAALMEYVNELYKLGASKDDQITLAKLLKPFAPHLASEMLEELKSDDVWPVWDEKYLASDTVEVVVQINGKLRAKLVVDKADLEDEKKVIEIAKKDEKVKKYTTDGVKKTIFVKKANLLNIVV